MSRWHLKHTAIFVWLACCAPPRLQAEDVSVSLRPEPLRLEVMGPSGPVAELVALSATEDDPEYEAQVLPGWDGYRAREGAWREAKQRGVKRSSTQTLVVEFDIGELEVSTRPARVDLVWRVTAARFNKVQVAFASGEDEHYFGLGERFASVDHRGLSLYAWAEEGGLGAGEGAASPRDQFPYPNGASMTYFPVPFVHSTAGFSLFANTSRRSEMRMAAPEAPDRFSVVANDRTLPITIYTRKQPLDRIADYSADTAFPMVPAPWVWGVRYRSSVGTIVFGKPEYQLFRERHIPITVIDDSVHFLPDNSQQGREAELLAFNQALAAWGYKGTAYNTPYVASSDAMSKADYAYGVERGLFQKKPDGTPATTFFISGEPLTLSAIDLTNPEGRAWYQTLLSRTIDLGYSGWMNDFGEYTAHDSIMFDGTTGEETHNLFPVLSAMTARGILEERLPNDNWLYVRSGFVGTQAYASEVWGGDPEASFDDTQGLPASVRGGINLGMVGVPYYGSDVTGFKCIAGGPYDKEVHIRWVQFGAVSPVFHHENACANPLGSASKWNMWNDEETVEAWRVAASFHTRLAPYLRTLAHESHTTGRPIMVHPFLTHPEEREAWGIEDSYYFGPSLYAAPVVRRGVTTRHVWLPPGRYVEWTDKTVHAGPGYVDVPAPLSRLPLFVVENTLLPMLDAEVQTLAPATEPGIVTEETRKDVLDVIATLSANGSAHMTLHDGTEISVSRGAQGFAEALGELTRTRLTLSAPAGEADNEGVHAQVSGGPARTLRVEVWGLP